MYVIETPVVFGKPEFWSTAFNSHGTAFESLTRLGSLAGEMFCAVERMTTMTELQKAVVFLSRMIADSMNDVITLCGNGSGVSAVKISRSMFEASVTAEYLRHNPTEVEDYSKFAAVSAWRYYQFQLKTAPNNAKRMSGEKIKKAFDAVKARFVSRKGNVRNTWSAKKISDMAREIGRGNEYELVYAVASSLHHANAEGLIRGHFKRHNGQKVWDNPPSLNWTLEALVAAHVYFIYGLKTMNECCKLGFEDRLKAAEHDCETCYSA